MKVLQINSVCGVGSTGRIVADIHKSLKEKEYESYIAYGRGEAKNCDSAIRIGSDSDVYAHVALTRIFDKHGFGSKRATLKFLKIVEKLDPDLIHLHNIHGYYINIEDLFNFLKAFDKPVVWTLHDCWAFTGHCSYFDYIGCEKWKTGCFNCPQKNRYPKSYILDNSKKNYEMKKMIFTGLKKMVIVTPSQWLANLVKQSFLKEYPIEVIPNGIDTNVFKPTQGNFRKKYNLEGKFIILGVANVWEERKGLKYFIELSKILYNDDVIILVGLNKKQLKEMPYNIIGIERTNNVEELVEIYSSADVFVNPTLEDNFPTVNLEALSCGTPVITFNTGGSVEAIDENTGFIVEKGNVNDFYEKIKIVKFSGKEKYSQYCRSRVVEFFNKESNFGKYLNLYHDLFERNNLKKERQ